MQSTVRNRKLTVLLGDDEVEVKYSATVDSGRLSGPPEFCYPPEEDMEILWSSRELTDEETEQVEQQCWDDFNEVQNERGDYLFDAAREDRVCL